MFWNLGNWNRKAHSKCPLPEHLEKFRPHIKFDLNTEHRPIGDKSLYNNSLSLLSRTSRLTCFWTMKLPRSMVGRHASMISQTWCVLHVLEKTVTSLRLQALARMMMTQVHALYHGQSSRSCGENTQSYNRRRRGPWPYLGPMLPYVGPVLPLCWPYVSLCWPYVGLCWPHVGPMWPILGLCSR